MANLNQLTRTNARAKNRVGRGGKRGKTSGRGTKGQNARAGRKKRPEWRDIIKKLPKRRGYGKNRGRTVVSTRPDAFALSLDRVAGAFEAGSEVTRASLIEKGIVRARSIAPVKIVAPEGEATFSKKLSFKGLAVSASARTLVEKAGGTIV